ncbi:microsomal signal peptidase 12kDa subunit [Diplocarpon rosae]|nr:microsomal signal peptidase 12kDa subunit [Diplocarpon rosae]
MDEAKRYVATEKNSHIMADQILEQVRDLAEGQIVAFIVGFVKEDIKLALRIGLAGSALTLLMVVPPWGFFKRHPVKWLPVADKGTHSQGTIVDGMVVI